MNTSEGRATGKQEPASLERVVTRAIMRMLPSGPSAEAVATSLSLNVRTMQRRLFAAGISYRELLDKCRYRAAEDHLRKGELSIAEVASLLGYSDPSHFVRAFRRWTGTTPSEYCKQHQTNLD